MCPEKKEAPLVMYVTFFYSNLMSLWEKWGAVALLYISRRRSRSRRRREAAADDGTKESLEGCIDEGIGEEGKK